MIDYKLRFADLMTWEEEQKQLANGLFPIPHDWLEYYDNTISPEFKRKLAIIECDKHSFPQEQKTRQITDMESHAILGKWLNEQVQMLNDEFPEKTMEYFEVYIKPLYLAWNRKITVVIPESNR